MKLRMKDIANLVGVSETTVSLVINNKPCRVSQKTRQEILKIAQKNNYQPNMMARGLAKNESKVIGLIIPDMENMFFATLAKGLEQQCYDSNYFTIIVNSNDNQELELSLVNELISIGVDGLLIALSTESYYHSKKIVTTLKELKVPFVLLDRNFKDYDFHQVYFDNYLGGYLATEYLIKLGHKNIGFMRGPTHIEVINDRFKGYLAALEQYEIPFVEEFSVTGDLKFLGGYSIADYLLANKKITGIIAANDLMLFGFLKKASEMNIDIPNDISVVGYDRTKVLQMYPLNITTIEQNVLELSKRAWSMLNLLLSDNQHPSNKIKLVPKLVVGDSCRKIN